MFAVTALLAKLERDIGAALNRSVEILVPSGASK
jgi:hypothetical protein